LGGPPSPVMSPRVTTGREAGIAPVLCVVPARSDCDGWPLVSALIQEWEADVKMPR